MCFMSVSQSEMLARLLRVKHPPYHSDGKLIEQQEVFSRGLLAQDICLARHSVLRP